MIDNIIKQSMTEDVLISSEIASSMHNPLNIKIYDEIDSTNRQMKDNIRKGEAACPDLIIAGCQTAGRGRLGRKFESPQGTGIYMTYKIDPDKAASNPILITSAAAVAVAAGDSSLPPLLAETASISLRHPLRPAGSSLRRLYRIDPSVCGCGTEPAAGIVKRDPRP